MIGLWWGIFWASIGCNMVLIGTYLEMRHQVEMTERRLKLIMASHQETKWRNEVW